MNVLDFKQMKETGTKISMITCYDYTSAKIVADSDIDCILVGDSSAMVMHGETSTVNSSVDQICAHIKAVKNAVAAIVIDDFRPKINPNSIVAQPT